jgi:hypothetical protein
MVYTHAPPSIVKKQMDGCCASSRGMRFELGLGLGFGLGRHEFRPRVKRAEVRILCDLVDL